MIITMVAREWGDEGPSYTRIGSDSGWLTEKEEVAK